ncbi:hypothetical protein, unlikely [Trypanosoma brucei brucei TREU927]|uniref:Secreted protein n=1 Tax=Trypanosoma brucei brucei (strain 927/4 GUTat10.1) TaxID=185431 RepID=Q38ER9_TRYB2|nr:hypothetical protein, unlikely [Trypanosoma brucei brucei TREU927]EAN76701.1 hypothetical protein, unlikely [Trypanosoma brucei brucei TREU927]
MPHSLHVPYFFLCVCLHSLDTHYVLSSVVSSLCRNLAASSHSSLVPKYPISPFLCTPFARSLSVFTFCRVVNSLLLIIGPFTRPEFVCMADSSDTRLSLARTTEYLIFSHQRKSCGKQSQGSVFP